MAIGRVIQRVTGIAGASVVVHAPLPGMNFKDRLLAKVVAMRAWPEQAEFTNLGSTPFQDIVLQMNHEIPVDQLDKDSVCRVSIQPKVMVADTTLLVFHGVLEPEALFQSLVSRAPVAFKPTFLAVSTNIDYPNPVVFVETFYQLFVPTDLQYAQLAAGSME